MFLTSLKQTCNEYLIKFSENQSAPKLENRKTSPCYPCAPNLLHVLVSWILGYHNLCCPVINVIKRNRYDCYHLSPSRKSAAFFNPNNIRIVPSKKLPQARGKQDNGKQGNGKQARGKQGNGKQGLGKQGNCTLNSAQTK